MLELTPAQHILRLFIVALVGSVMAWGYQFLPPDDYQPSRPIYTACWLIAAVGAYISLRRRNQFAASVARVLAVIIACVFVLTMFM